MKELLNNNKMRIMRFLSLFIFGFIVALTFVFIHLLIPFINPLGNKMHNEIATVIFILISILVLFPLRDFILTKMNKRGYLSYFILKDNQLLDTIERPFSIESLIQKEFPELMDWLSLFESSLAILESDRKSYLIYKYKNRKIIDKVKINKKEIDKLNLFLGKKNIQINLFDMDIPDEVGQQLKKLGYKIAYPLLFRKTVLGLLLFNQVPKSIYAKSILEVFCHQSALTIHNHILSLRVIDSRIYDNEFKTARRILRSMENLTPHNLDNYKIEKITFNKAYLLEYFKLNKDNHLFQIMICDELTGSLGLLIYGLVGELFSYINLYENNSLKKIIKYLEKSFNWKYAISQVQFLFLEFNKADESINLFSNDVNFSVSNFTNNDFNNVTQILPNKLINIKLNNNLINNFSVNYSSHHIFNLASKEKLINTEVDKALIEY